MTVSDRQEPVEADLDVLRGQAEEVERLFDNASKVARRSTFGQVTAERASKTADAIRTAIVEIEFYRSQRGSAR